MHIDETICAYREPVAVQELTPFLCLISTRIIKAIPKPVRKPVKASGIEMRNLLKKGPPVDSRQPIAKRVLSGFDIFVFLIISVLKLIS